MKRAIPTLLILSIVAAVLAAPGAEAGLFDKWNKNKNEKSNKPPRYDLLPTMSFHTGILGRDVGQGWTLGDLRLSFAPDCEINTEVDHGSGLDEGREALVMGSRLGNTIVAWRVLVKKNEYGLEARDSNIQFIPSEVDPTVGEGSGPE